MMTDFGPLFPTYTSSHARASLRALEAAGARVPAPMRARVRGVIWRVYPALRCRRLAFQLAFDRVASEHVATRGQRMKGGVQ